LDKSSLVLPFTVSFTTELVLSRRMDEETPFLIAQLGRFQVFLTLLTAQKKTKRKKR